MPTEEPTPTTAPGGVLGYNRVMRCNLHALMEYKGGDYLIYSDLMAALAKTLKKRIKDKHQNVILVVGPTGSGKSTFLHAIINALLCNRSHKQVKFLLIDLCNPTNIEGSPVLRLQNRDFFGMI